MVMTTKERTELRNELVGQGYSWEFVDEWQPKITLYRHAPKANTEGVVVSEVGTSVRLPGNPVHALRYARRGMLPYPPSEVCECKWCAVRNVHAEQVVEEEENVLEKESVFCQDCGKSISALTKAGALSKMRVHVKTHQSKA